MLSAQATRSDRQLGLTFRAAAGSAGRQHLERSATSTLRHIAPTAAARWPRAARWALHKQDRLDARVPSGPGLVSLGRRSRASVLVGRTQQSHSACCGVHLVCLTFLPACGDRVLVPVGGPVDRPSLAGRFLCCWCCPVGRVGSRAGVGLTRSLSVGHCSGLTTARCVVRHHPGPLA
jgi:hypothetical protein